MGGSTILNGTLAAPVTLDAGTLSGTGAIQGSPTGFDQLIISGAATLGGALNILLADGFLPTSGQSFSILQFGSRGGAQFASVNLPNPWSRLVYLDKEVLFLYQTPEPASWLLLAGALGWILRRRYVHARMPSCR